MVASVHGSNDERLAMKEISEFFPKRPGSIREQADESLVCAHRDITFCGECATKYAGNVVEVYGQHYWANTLSELSELLSELRYSRSVGA